MGYVNGVLAGVTSLLIAGAAVAVLAPVAGPWLVRRLVRRMATRLARDPYAENLFELVHTAKRLGGVQGLMEALMRAEQGGRPIARPWGTPLRFSPWDKLLLNPTYLFRMPPPDGARVDTSAVIGPRARKPLRIEIPLMVAGMSYGGALSERMKVALAKGASAMGTATNTGEGYLPEERAAASKLIVQYHRGGWPNSAQNRREILARADAIEIQIGQGAQAGSPQTTPAAKIDERMREVYGLRPHEDAVIHSRLAGVDRAEDLVRLVGDLRERYGVPVGLKIGATHHLERELEIALRAGIDFFVVDGAEGGSHAAAPILEDDTGLPTMYALVRAVDYLRARGVKDDVSVIAAGGLQTPGHFLKALALGADAVYVGTIAGIAAVGLQFVKSVPGEPPSVLAFRAGHQVEDLDVGVAARKLEDFLKSCVREMETATIALGKTAFTQVDRSDLVALDPWVAAAARVDLAWLPPGSDWQDALRRTLARPIARADRGDERPSPSGTDGDRSAPPPH